MRSSGRKTRVLPAHVFKKIKGHKLTPRCIGCGKKFVTMHSAKKYCDDCLGKTNKRKATRKKKTVLKKKGFKKKVANKKSGKKASKKR